MPPRRPFMSRRAFLRAALGLGAGAIAASLPLAGCHRPDYPAPGFTPALFTAKELAVLEAACRRLLPAGAGRPGGGELAVARAADALLATANPRLQRDLKQLLNTFEDQTWLALRLQPFTAMAPAAQDAYVAAWLDGPLPVMRQGAVALNKLAGMLYFMDPRAWTAIGYPGPWIGRYDFGLGLDNQGEMPESPNPQVFVRHSA